MLVTTLLFMRVAIHARGWSITKAIIVGIPLLVIDLGFFGAQLVKIPHGGWFAISVGIIQFLLMTTWRKGRLAVAGAIRRGETSIADFVDQIERGGVARVPGTAVFLFKDAGAAPPALLKNVEHNAVMHRHVLLVSILTADRPNVPESERSEIVPIAEGLWQVILTFGFRDEPNVPEALAVAAAELGAGSPDEFTYFLGRESIIASSIPNMPMWQERLFVMQTRTAASAARFFHLPAQRVFEVGTTVEI
jgi:KUP system potassium uptake protein